MQKLPEPTQQHGVSESEQEHPSPVEGIAWVQTTIPSPSAALLAVAIQDSLNTRSDLSENAYNMLAQLRDYFQDVALNPRAFPPRETMASSLKQRARLSRGIRRNDGTFKDGQARPKVGRKSRRQRRAEAARTRRAARAGTVAAHNLQRDDAEAGAVAAHAFISQLSE